LQELHRVEKSDVWKKLVCGYDALGDKSTNGTDATMNSLYRDPSLGRQAFNEKRDLQLGRQRRAQPLAMIDISGGK